MTDHDLRQLLFNRIQQQGIESNDMPLFLKDLSTLLKLTPSADAATLNARLKLLGWHQVQLDYQSLQLALAWMEAEAEASSPLKPM